MNHSHKNILNLESEGESVCSSDQNSEELDIFIKEQQIKQAVQKL